MGFDTIFKTLPVFCGLKNNDGSVAIASAPAFTAWRVYKVHKM